MKIVIATDDEQPNRTYLDALLCAGALPEELVLASPGAPAPEAFDGLLLAGGADVDPARYGETAEAPGLVLRRERDDLDFGLFASAEMEGVPVFGICRGMQVLNVALGGTLWQDLPSQRDRGTGHAFYREDGFDAARPAHVVRTRARSGASHLLPALLGSGEITVNSRHHQAIRDLAPGLVPVAASPDDLVEAVERPGGAFLGAVQWHPEDLVARPEQKRLLGAFLEAARGRARSAGREGHPPVEVVLEGSVPVVTMRRPSRGNALAGPVLTMLADTLEALAGDRSVPALVLTGEGESFCVGEDLESLAARVTLGDLQGFRSDLLAGRRAVLALLSAPWPSVAALDGSVAGPGLSLALACDVRIASAGVLLSLGAASSGCGVAPLAMAAAGRGAAVDLVLWGDTIPAARGRELGLVDSVVDGTPVEVVARRRAARAGERPFLAVSAARERMNAGLLALVKDDLTREIDSRLELFRSGELAARLGGPGVPRT